MVIFTLHLCAELVYCTRYYMIHVEIVMSSPDCLLAASVYVSTPTLMHVLFRETKANAPRPSHNLISFFLAPICLHLKPALFSSLSRNSRSMSANFASRRTRTSVLWSCSNVYRQLDILENLVLRMMHIMSELTLCQHVHESTPLSLWPQWCCPISAWRMALST